MHIIIIHTYKIHIYIHTFIYMHTYVHNYNSLLTYTHIYIYVQSYIGLLYRCISIVVEKPLRTRPEDMAYSSSESIGTIELDINCTSYYYYY